MCINPCCGEDYDLINCLSFNKARKKEKQSKQSLTGKGQFMFNEMGCHVKSNYSNSPVSLDMCELILAAACIPCHNSDTKIQ